MIIGGGGQFLFLKDYTPCRACIYVSRRFTKNREGKERRAKAAWKHFCCSTHGGEERSVERADPLVGLPSLVQGREIRATRYTQG